MAGRSLASRLATTIAVVTASSITVVAVAITVPMYYAAERRAIDDARSTSVSVSGRLQFETGMLLASKGRPLADAELASTAAAMLRREAAEHQTGFAVVDGRGRVLASDTESAVGGDLAALGLSPAADRQLSEQGHALAAWNGDPSLIVRQPVALPGQGRRWTIYIASPVSFALSNARDSAIVAFLLGVMVILLSTLVAWLWGRRLALPVARMAATMRRMAGGDLEVTTPPATGASELGDMADALETFRTTARDKLAAEAARQAAEQTAQDRTAFLAVMSHEIRTPMNGVLGMAQALERTPLTPRQQHMLQVLADSGSALMAMLDAILDASNLESNQLELISAPFDLDQLVNEVVELSRSAAVLKGVKLHIETSSRLPAVLGDSARVRQVLHNLVSNGVKFTSEGNVTVRVTPIPVSGDETRIRFDVVDTGIGVSPEIEPKLFRKFETGDPTSTRTYGGVGLGLAISRDLARRMNGDVTLQPHRGGGAAFRFELPLRHVDAPSLIEQPAAPPDQLNVLVAEDADVNRQVLGLLLETIGAEVTFALDGVQAVDLWRRGAFDLVLMDVQMPVMDGLEATALIRAEEAAAGRPRTPIIAVTANAMPHQARECRHAGMDAHVIKPIDPGQLIAAISDAAEACSPEAVAAVQQKTAAAPPVQLAEVRAQRSRGNASSA